MFHIFLCCSFCHYRQLFHLTFLIGRIFRPLSWKKPILPLVYNYYFFNYRFVSTRLSQVTLRLNIFVCCHSRRQAVSQNCLHPRILCRPIHLLVKYLQSIIFTIYPIVYNYYFFNYMFVSTRLSQVTRRLNIFVCPRIYPPIRIQPQACQSQSLVPLSNRIEIVMDNIIDMF